MSSRRKLTVLLSLTMFAGALAGCHPTPPPPPPPPPGPATAEQASMLQHDLTRFDANASIGKVAAIRSQDMMLAITGIPVNSVKEGDVVSIIDSANATIALGTVLNLPSSDQYLIVKYEVQSGHRAPEAGDAVVRFQSR